MNRETPVKINGLYEFPPFVLDPLQRRLLRDGEPVRLRTKTFDLLLTLVESAGDLLTRDDLIQAVWPDTIVEEHGLTVGMSSLRKALGDEDDPPHFIATVRGRGYRFVAPVTFNEAQASLLPRIAHAGPERSLRRPITAMMLVVLLCAVVGYAIIRGGTSDGNVPLAMRAVDPSTPTIAVLPFEHAGEDNGNMYFAKGMRQTILARLARIGGLRVISRTSSDDYPSHPQNLETIATELGVTTVLEGHIQTSGQQVLINMQLIEARTGRQLWAGSYTRTLVNVFEVENDVAAHVATALEARLLPADTARLARQPTTNPEAYLIFLKANYFEDQVTNRNNADLPESAANQAIALYREAIKRDPEFALAHARLSLLESHAYWSSIRTSAQAIPSARSAALRAIELDPSLPEAWLAMGYVHYYGERNYSAALTAFKHAAEQVPNDMHAKVAIAYIQRRQGKLAEAIEGMREASKLDPRNPRWPHEMGISLMALGDYVAADLQFARSLAIEPHNFYCVTHRARALLLAGNPQRARSVLDEVAAVADPLGLVSTLRFEIARLDRDPERALASLAPQLEWVQAPNMGGNIPRSLLEAEAWLLRGDLARAAPLLRNAASELQALLVEQPHNPDAWSALGMAHAGLGLRDDALAAARRATEIVPMSRDVVDGVLYTTVLARAHARLGEAAMAVRLLRELLDMPGGMYVSKALLKTDPSWDAIRDNPAFQALLNDKS